MNLLGLLLRFGVFNMVWFLGKIDCSVNTTFSPDLS
jgi:hypothetical protein